MAMRDLRTLEKELASSSTHSPMPLTKAIEQAVWPLSSRVTTDPTQAARDMVMYGTGMLLLPLPIETAVEDLQEYQRWMLGWICQAMIVPRAMMDR